jgi:hypothetical protein
MQAFVRKQTFHESRSDGEVSSEPQPLLRRREPAPKSQWVMVVAPEDHGSGWLGVIAPTPRMTSVPGGG